MKIHNKLLIWLFVGLLLVAVALAFLLDPGIGRVLTQPPGEYTIHISEICAKNETVTADNTGAYRDYIELYNAGEAVSLEGFRLTDGSSNVHVLGDIHLGAGEYRVIFLGKDLTGFALSASGGDTIQLQDPAGRIVAQTKISAMQPDQVMLLRNGIYVNSQEATPGFSNDAEGLKAFREGHPAAAPRLVINEVLIGNASVLPDENGVYTDIVELHNISDAPVELGTYSLSDSIQERFRFRLPDVTVPAGGYVVIHCDSGSYVTEEGVIHASFGLSIGETVCLTDGQGGYVTLNAAWVGENLSLCRNENGTYETMSATPGFANDENGMQDLSQMRINPDAPLVISEVLLSAAGVPYEGGFRDVIEVYNRTQQPVSTTGWYLSDGGDPYAYPLPEQTLQPGQTLTVVCETAVTGFGLSVGETACLTGPDYRHAPQVTCVEPPAGQSISLQPGTELSYNFAEPTPGFANTEEGAAEYAQYILPQGLRISELMTDNTLYLRGPYGATCDWVELYNGSDQAVELGDYCLSDDSGQLFQCSLPEKTLQPGDYCIVLLTRTPADARAGYPMAELALSGSGDTLYLTCNGRVADYAVIPELSRDVSYGRAGGSAQWCILSKVTVNGANSAPRMVSRTPQAVTPQGTYDNVEYLDVELFGYGDIYYTTDCSVPTRYSKRYTGPIRITNTTVLRVVCFEEGKERSGVLDLTYILNENDNLSVVSIVAHPDDLFSQYKGIYATGLQDPGPYPHKEANYWKDWEKSASVSLFETDGSVGFSVPCGLKIFGGFSRAQAKKSLTCVFREKYGASELEYPLFGEEGLLTYESFVLRAGGQDAYNARMRDEMITSLASEHLNLPVQDYRPVVLYLNGRYWGVYYIREKLNEQYVAGHFNVTKEEVIISEWAGDYCPEYKSLLRWARTHDMNVQANYDRAYEIANVQNYMDYMITQMWIGNSDNGNVKFFMTSEHPWHWILFDTDQSFRSPQYNAIAEHLDPNKPFKFDVTSKTLLRALLKRPEFKEIFLRRMAWQINNVWTEENVIGRIDEIAAMIQPDLEKDCKRWNVRYGLWESSVEHLREFAQERTRYFMTHVKQYFGLTDAQMREYGFPI